MRLRFYGYNKCDTCRKAEKFLKTRIQEFESIDITLTAPSLTELKGAAAKYGVKKLFNTSGVVYREMKLGEKLPSLSDSEALKLLSSNGRLVKRPFVITANSFLVGFQAPEWEKAI